MSDIVVFVWWQLFVDFLIAVVWYDMQNSQKMVFHQNDEFSI
jgi:hypothetical protein